MCPSAAPSSPNRLWQDKEFGRGGSAVDHSFPDQSQGPVSALSIFSFMPQNNIAGLQLQTYAYACRLSVCAVLGGPHVPTEQKNLLP